jgi:translocation and assembly module TamB
VADDEAPPEPGATPSGGRLGRAGRALAGMAVVLLSSATFVMSAAGGLVLHLNLATTRRVVRDVVNELFVDLFAGEVRIGPIEHLSPRSLSVASFHAKTPDGVEVIQAEGIRLRGAWLAPVLRLAGAGGRGRLSLGHLRVERGFVGIEIQSDGSLPLAGAFASRSPSPPSPSGEGGDFTLDLATVELGEVRAAGSLAPAVPLDAIVSRLLARVQVGTAGIAIDVDRSSIREDRLLGATIQGTSDFHLRGRFAPDAAPAKQGLQEATPKFDLWGSFGGHLDRLQVVVDTQIHDGVVTAHVDLPRVGREDVAGLLPDAPLTRPVSAHLSLHGRAPVMQLTGAVEVPAMGTAAPGRVKLHGTLDARKEVLITAVVDVADFDARLLSVDLPHTKLGLVADVTARLAGTSTDVRVDFDGRSSSWGEHLIPTTSGVVEVGPGQVEARLVVEEAGAESDLFARWDAVAGLVFAARAHAPSLARVPRLRQLLGAQRLDGRARVRAEGRLSADGDLDLFADADLAALDVDAANLKVAGTHAFARLSGPTDKPERMHLDATVVSSDANLDGRKLPQVQLKAVGPLGRPTVLAEVTDDLRREIEAKAVVDSRSRSLTGVDVRLVDGSVTLDGHVERIRSVDDLLALEDIQLDGLGGQVRGGLQIRDGELVGELSGSEIDLPTLSRLLGLKFPVRGKASLDVAIAHDATGRAGHAQLRISDGGVLIVGGLGLSVDTRFDGEQVTTEAALVVDNPLGHESDHACAKTIGTFTLEDAEVALRGPLLAAETWRDADMAGNLELESADLACLAEIWQEATPLAPIPVSELTGILDAAVGLARKAGQTYPSITQLGAKTTGLVVAGRPEKPDGPAAWRSDALDLAVAGSLDGVSGDATLSVALLDDDRKTTANLARPPLVRLSVEATALDLQALSEGGEQARDALVATRGSASLETTRSALSRWLAIPAPYRDSLPPLAGEVEVDAYLEGSAADPSIAVRARAWGLHRERADRRKRHHNDLDFLVSYEGREGRVDGTLRRDGERVAVISAESQGDLAVRVLGRGQDPRWTGWVRAEFDELELSSLPPLADQHIAGAVSGSISLRGLGETPKLSANLKIPELSLGSRAQFAKVDVAIVPVSDGRALSLQASFPAVVDGRPDGMLRVVGYGSLEWDRLLVPKPALDQPAGMYLVAEQFPLDGVQPFLGSDIARAGGRLDGEMRLGYREQTTQPISLDMDMRLSRGVLQLVGYGREVHGIEAHMVARGGLLKVDELELRSGTGRASGSLRAGLDGLGFNVITGSLSIDEEEPFPVDNQGVSMGTVSGRIDTNISMRDEAMDVLLVTRELRLRLPPSSNRNVQRLEAHPDVAVMQATSAPVGEVEEEQAEPTPVRVTVVLSPTIIEGNQLRIALLTEAPIEIAPDGTVSGEIIVTGGELTVLDKTFRIDRGTVLMREEEPGNPYLNVTAHWDAPDGSTVFVDYVGPIKPMARDNFTFRSNPSRPESEVLALLIFGDASAGAAAQDQSNRVANSVAAAQFNALVGQLAPGLTTKVSTSSASLSYQITDSVTLSATFDNAQDPGAGVEAEGDETAGGAPDNQFGRSEVSVDWRFAEQWLLRGTVGVGTGSNSGVDLLFQHRY